MKRAVFLDRDGTVIVDKAYLDNVDDVELLPEAGEGLAAMRELDYLLVLITNQSGVGRGYFEEDVVVAQYHRLQMLLEAHSLSFAGMEYCPHAPQEGCECRKPKPGMLLKAAEELGIDLRASFMIGDKESDILAGIAAGCKTIRIGSLEETQDTLADYLAGNLVDAAEFIAKAGRERPRS